LGGDFMSTSQITWTRLVIALLQGLALLVLQQAAQHRFWPATDGPIFAALWATAFFIALLAISGLGNLRPRTLAIWAIAATILCASIAAYDIWRRPDVIIGLRATPTPNIFPDFATWAALAAILFIVHTLIVAGEADHRFIATYPRHFDIAWKHGVQAVLATAFVSILWGLLFLGAQLFHLIRIEYFWELIRKPSFAIPVTAIAFGGALHITDVRANIVQGTRTLLLTLLAWLLPVMTLIAAAFLVALIFTGLDPLWSTKRATSILLIATAALVFLVNAAHQDGRVERHTVPALGYAKVLAAAIMVVLTALAGYGLALRVGQYGWTTVRIIAVACAAVATFYGVGYFIAALRSRQAMKELETTNILTSLVIVGVLIALTSPIADPARIAVADQVRRLESGAISADRFDFAFLRFNAGRFGMEALERLGARPKGPNAAEISVRARAALRAASRYQMNAAIHRTPQQRARSISVLYPKGATLPSGFISQDWSKYPQPYRLPICLRGNGNCGAMIVDLDDDGRPEILLFMLPYGSGYAFKSDSGGKWAPIGTLSNSFCWSVREHLRDGAVEVAAAPYKDVIIGGERLHITEPCKPRPPKPRNPPAQPAPAR
jgi:hypothetical protein